MSVVEIVDKMVVQGKSLLLEAEIEILSHIKYRHLLVLSGTRNRVENPVSDGQLIWCICGTETNGISALLRGLNIGLLSIIRV